MALSCVPVGGAGPPAAPVVPAAQAAAPGGLPFETMLQGWSPGKQGDAGQMAVSGSQQVRGGTTGSGSTPASASAAAAEREAQAGGSTGAAQDDSPASAPPENDDHSMDDPAPAPDGASESASALNGQVVALLLAQVTPVSVGPVMPQAAAKDAADSEVPAVTGGPAETAASCASNAALGSAQSGVAMQGAGSPAEVAAPGSAQPEPVAAGSEAGDKLGQIPARAAEAPAGDVPAAGLQSQAESAPQGGTIRQQAQTPEDRGGDATLLDQAMTQTGNVTETEAALVRRAGEENAAGRVVAQAAGDRAAGVGPGNKARSQTATATGEEQSATDGAARASTEGGKPAVDTARPDPTRQLLTQQSLANADAHKGAPAGWKSGGAAGPAAVSEGSEQPSRPGGEVLNHLASGLTQVGPQAAGTGMPASAGQAKPVAQPVPFFDVQSLAGQIVRHAQTWVHEGQTDVRLQLDPPNLGQVEVRLSHQEQGVSITLAAGQANGAQVLGARLDELRQGLVAAGVPLLDLSLEQGQTSWKQGGQETREGPSGPAQPLAYHANPRAEVAFSRGGPAGLGTGALEIWI